MFIWPRNYLAKTYLTLALDVRDHRIVAHAVQDILSCPATTNLADSKHPDRGVALCHSRFSADSTAAHLGEDHFTLDTILREASPSLSG